MSTTMQFGPEWMRPKTQTNSRSSTREPSPPPGSSPAGTSSYSALVTPPPAVPVEMNDATNPFKYSRDEMLRIYKEGGGRGGLGLEVERWEGVVRELSSDPIGLKEMSEGDKKLFAGSLNSELRRRQSTDYLSPLTVPSGGGERPKLYHTASGAGSPMRERFGGILGRRGTADSPSLSMPRKSSVSSLNPPLASPRDAGLPSPRTRTGFDGVLGGSDSWMARRRTSDATRPSGIALSRSTDTATAEGKKDPEIKEEQEEEGQRVGLGIGASVGHASNGQPSATNGHLANTASGRSGPSTVEGLDQSFDKMSLGAVPGANLPGPNGAVTHAYPLGSHVIAPQPPPPTTAELSAVEWSYVDPAGNIQGPFRADIMQNWHDAGFFTPDLMMKRTHLDTNWTSVGDMTTRASTAQIFLVPFVPAPVIPPGLVRRQGSTPDPFPGGNSFNAPFQPIPQRSLRTATLDTFLGGGASGLDSPTSSFAAGRFSNGSPDHVGFGSRPVVNTGPDTLIGSRFGGPYSAAPEPISQYGPRRGTLNDPMGAAFGGSGSPFGPVSQSPSLGGAPSYHTDHIRTPIENPVQFGSGFGSSPAQSFAQPSVLSSNGLPSMGMHRSGSINLGGAEHIPDNHLTATYNGAVVGQRFDPGTFPNTEGHLSSGPITRDPPTTLGPAIQFGSHAQVPTTPSITTSQPASALPAEVTTPAEAQGSAAGSLASPWGARETVSIRRVSPFDAPHPKASKVIPVEPSTPAKAKQFGGSQASESSQPQPANAWTSRATPTSTTKPGAKQSPWVAATNGVVEEGWSEPHGVTKLTTSNLAQHNQQQHETPVAEPSVAPSAPTPAPEPTPPVPAPIAVEEATPTPAEAPAPTSKQSRRKASQALKAAAAETTPAPPASAPVEAPAAQPAVAKAAWATADEKKSKSSSAMGFREIQEAEAKKLEARKAAEKDRARASTNTTAATPTADEAPAFTASWGLPTSQTAARTPTAGAKEQVPNTTTAAGSPAPPVWTATTKPATTGKKSMKEIQEEEERRKKAAAKEKETAAAAARRAYAETTTKASTTATPATPTPAPANAWTTVGTGGKPSATATVAAAPARPAAAGVTSANATPTTAATRVANGSASRPSTAASVAAAGPQAPKRAVTPATSRADEFPLPPSQDFLKWLGESLKGLNSSVNYEDMTAMLLSFPPDDPSTAEIISDLVYANSTTLDGRRFAAEFVSKRAADASARAKGVTKPMTATSIADVVRTQPKPAQQNEWGGFKVVNKKKKGGRS